MCLAVPARVVSIDGLEAEVDMGGISRRISLWLTPEVQVGDWVHVHTGYAIGVIDEAEAQETLRLLRELLATYPEEELTPETGHEVPG
jgi:hydrogenase expression/formation protein HypC